MRKFFVAIGLLIVAAIAEVTLIVVIAGRIGVLPTFGLLVLTTALGVWLLSRNGPKSWRAIKAEVDQRRPPTLPAADGLYALIACLMVVVPGFITDLIGLVMLLPPVRRFAGDRMMGVLAKRLPPEALGPVKVRAKRSRSRRTKDTATATENPPIETADSPTSGPSPAGSSTSGPADEANQGSTRPAPADEVLEGEVLEGEIVDDTIRS